uniref:ATP-binding cassette sub-family G member 8 n=1 Tax=Coccidioides posadasii RMSCC 3488 TaxID=454284 RepID=A0A0J6HZW1_COCPO|nr:ATP-binding cassette sub-family G member 8 [Coccidioides posadasii RMSCC 3488]
MIAEEKGISRVEADEEAAIGIDSHVQAAKHQSRTHLSFRKVQPVDVHVKELVVRVDTVPPIWQSSPSLLWDRLRRKTKGEPLKTVLDGVTAAMPSGSLTAIIGGSGSGKTSLLNVLAGRMNTGRVKISGSATFNGHDNINSVRSAYVMQQDVLIPTLTVRETLQYSADLRLPPPTTHDERQNVVNNVILELGLKECADTRIGTTTHKGCSGGEKRRTSIGVQMLSNPSVLFCDEPTTGLDATSAFQVIKTLKALARDGRTVIVSIHAPRSEIWGLFDQVILLSRGSVLYSGPVDMALSHFEECGHSIPAFVNPAEFLIDLAAYDNRSEESEFFSRERIEKLQRAWRESPNNRLLDEKASSQNRGIASEKAYQSITPQKGASFGQQFRVLTARTMKMTVRDPMGMTASLFEAIGMAVMNGWVYLRLDRSLAGIRSRQGSLYTASSLNGYLILLYEVFRLTTDIQLFDRERNEGVIPVYVRWIKWMTYTFYVFGALCANEFIGPSGPPEGQFYDCPFSDDPSDPYCKEYTGRFILETLGLPSNWIWRPMVALVGFITLFFGAAYLILQFRKVDMDIAQSRSSEGDLSAGKEKFVARLPDKSHHVSIRLDNYALEIQKRRIGKRGIESRRLRILRPISAEFRPGQLNVIMGPSGSGKTSLLCSIARRLHGSIGTRYHLSGQMLYNSSVPSENVIRAVSSFVTQDDDALMPSLTVRESLQFAAGLRLPSWMSKEEKNRRAEDILLKMGLKDCADNLIGSDLIKGISGGEKRRVTIAIQILTDPKVLLLDEPTSGLDAFTATSIIDALNGLAAEGRTLILTIHQARSDLFHYFSNILLLARGGHLVYAGKGSEMLPHFKQLGYPCPEATNPADFVLDLITIDLQEKGREDASRKRVQRLISGWEQNPVELTRQTSVISTPAELGSLKRKMSPFHLMYPLVLRRSAINLRRQPHLLVARTMQVIGIAIILTLFFAPLKKNYESVQSRMGFIQQLAAMYFVGMLQCIAIYPYERDVFYREESDNCYSVEAFILQYTSLELPFEIASSLIFGVVAAFAVRLESSVKMLFILAFNCFCIVSCGESLGIMFCTLFSHVGFSVNITSVLLSISTVLGGVLSLNVPAVLQAFNHLSPIKYSVSNLAPYAMTGQVFTCTNAQRLPNGNCPIETGEQVLMLYNQDDKDPAINVMALGLVAIGYRLVAYLLLKAMRSHGISKSIWIGLSKSSKKPQA